MRPALAAGAISLAYFLLLRTYGFQVEDEGTLLFWLERIANGQIPYRDFHTGYTPGYFYLSAALLKLSGDASHNLRAVLAVVNAATAAAMYALARRFVGPLMAAIAPALWVAFIPVYPGEFAAFNAPYPAWFAALAWLLLALALVTFSDTGRPRYLALAGAAAAFAFAIKPNAGAFGLAAATWVVAGTTRIGNTLDRVLGFVAAAGMGLGVWFAFGGAVWSVDALVHLVPLALILIVVCGPMAGLYADARHPHTTRALAVLGATFAGLTLVWAAPLLALLGPWRFASDVLLIGSDAAGLYYQLHPMPEPYALAVVGGVLGVVAGGALVKNWRALPLALLALGAAAGAGVVWWIATHALMPEGPLLSVSLQLENAAFWLAPLANWTGVAMLLAAAGRFRPLGDERRLAVLVPCAAAMYWQLYPRTDFMHVIMSLPITLVLAVRLLERVRDWWTQGAWPEWIDSRATVGSLLTAALIAVVALEIGPSVVAATGVPLNARVVDLPRLRVRLEPEAADDLGAFGRMGRYLEENARPGEPALAFPALAGALFAAGLTSPVAHDYWFPGRPSHEDERHMLDALRAAPPRFIVTLNDGWWFFTGAPAYYVELRAFVTESYCLTARFGRYDVLARSDVAAQARRVFEPMPAGTIDAVFEPYYGRRVQAVRRWMAGLTPEAAGGAALPSEPSRAILLLRGVRDAADLRATGWIVRGLGSPQPRIRAEAVDAAGSVAERFAATRLRWADDFDAAGYRDYVAPYRADADALAASAEPELRALGDSVLYVLSSSR